jgi:hypothetical protein
MEQDEHATARHLFALGLVAVIGLTGLVLMFKEVSPTGQVTQLKISSDIVTGCNAREILLNAAGVEMLKRRGRQAYGPTFSPYSDARISYNGVGYCADAKVVRELLG